MRCAPQYCQTLRVRGAGEAAESTPTQSMPLPQAVARGASSLDAAAALADLMGQQGSEQSSLGAGSLQAAEVLKRVREASEYGLPPQNALIVVLDTEGYDPWPDPKICGWQIGEGGK